MGFAHGDGSAPARTIQKRQKFCTGRSRQRRPEIAPGNSPKSAAGGRTTTIVHLQHHELPVALDPFQRQEPAPTDDRRYKRQIYGCAARGVAESVE